MRRVLTIAYDFPPRRTSGVYKTKNVTKYLRAFGWQPTILSVMERPGDLQDHTLLRDYPLEIRVERTPDLNISGWEKKAEMGILATGGLQSDSMSDRQPIRDRWIRAAGQLVRSLLYFPDDTIGWIPATLSRAIELHMKHRFDLVFTTSPARSAPVIGMLMKSLLGIPWVAEFRDPWYPPSRPWRRGFERVLLRQMLNSADVVVTVTQGLAAEFHRSFGLPAKKLAVINNGYEEQDFLAADGRRSDLLAPGYFHFSHFGTVYPGCSGRFFDALRELFQESPELRDRVRVNIVGFPDDTVRREASSDEFQQAVQLHGFVDHATAVAAMRSSDCLLILLANREVARLAVAGKTYEYLRTGRPILAVTYGGDTVELIRESQAGWVAHPEDVQAIKRALREAVGGAPMSANPSPIRPEFVEQFRYDRLAEKLARVFDSVSSHGA